MPRIAVYSATKHARERIDGGALRSNSRGIGVRVADVLPGLIDTAILRSTPNRSGDRAEADRRRILRECAQERACSGSCRASAVADARVDAYHSDKLHWYVPEEIAWIDTHQGVRAELHAQADRQAHLGGFLPEEAISRRASARMWRAGAAVEDVVADLDGAFQAVGPVRLHIGRVEGDGAVGRCPRAGSRPQRCAPPERAARTQSCRDFRLRSISPLQAKENWQPRLDACAFDRPRRKSSAGKARRAHAVEHHFGDRLLASHAFAARFVIHGFRQAALLVPELSHDAGNRGDLIRDGAPR